MKLLGKLLIGIILGIIIGLAAPEWVVRVLVTFKTLFGSFITFIVPFIILFFIASGVAGLGKRSGKLVGSTVGLAYVSTVLAGLLAFTVASFIIPMLTTPSEAVEEAGGLEPFLSFEIEPLMGIVTALVMAFVFGIGVSKTGSEKIKAFFDEGRDIIELVIAAIVIPLLPFYIAGIFSELAYEGTVFETLSLFAVVLILAISLHLVWLVIQYSTAGALRKQNPFKLLANMAPAYATAIGTMSSAATIPVTLQSVKKNNVKENIANFGVPLCATIHLSGSVITIVTCAMAVMMITPELAAPTLANMLPVIFMLGLIMVAAPGVPGGAIMAALGVLTSMLGFSEAAIGLMIALYMAQDSFGTATNVTGDGAINLIIDKFSKS
ncbi:dicarboxylate/amino acid:cation symporter [Alkalihalophilus pseudofirmus]|uniref:Dicarboxylate/amino acid:cation symporter n=1 Tax=Alkalihalophilus pseudofirmus TaxID=79885 RepID=A0AAJ2KZA3_ALKPS|nr:dicarboxylate/amino acid:cation symporter [Alkalihalophilus pseudofirmus]MDV2883545.1 dicarboxylate/amino acid:cation symporter [Alkalihalophilus pseudofirmus]